MRSIIRASALIAAIILMPGGSVDASTMQDVEQPGAPASPTNVRASDVSNYARDAIRVRWNHAPASAPGTQRSGYILERSTAVDGTFTPMGELAPTTTEFIDEDVEADALYVYRVIAADRRGGRSAPAELDSPVAVTLGPWLVFQRTTHPIFLWGRFYFLIIVVVICSALIFWIAYARSGKDLKVRKIAGLEAVDDAVGRATEMGRSCLFIPGIQDMNDIQTIAGITVLSRVAKTAAEYDARVEVPTARSLVMTSCRETVQAAYLAAGRPDAYNEDLIYYVTDEQFGYVAYLQGMMVREKPAACFYMGHFFAESLILAETGNGIGAIQVAGTAAPAQLPFFVAACDYTLIGEEFFAASAYLSGEPEQIGSLKGQDVGKIIVALGIIIGVLLATIASIIDSEALADAVEYFKGVVLT